jgi:hypothetical protein
MTFAVLLATLLDDGRLMLLPTTSEELSRATRMKPKIAHDGVYRVR